MGLKSKLKELVYRLRGNYTVDKLIKMGLCVGKNFNPQQGYNLDPSHCWLITIGDDVTFGPNVCVLAHDASMHGALGYTKIGRVTIGDRVFVGAGSIILPGVTIGDDAVIGAGSVVTKDVPGGYVFAGNPAGLIGTTEQFLDKHRVQMQTRPVYDESYTLRENVSAQKKAQQKEQLTNGVGYIL